MAIRVAVVGAGGRMGQEVLKALSASEDLEIVLAVDSARSGAHIREFAGPDAPDVTIEGKLGAALDRVPSDVLVDFTVHTAAGQHAMSALKRGVAPVIGTTGMSGQDIRELTSYSKETGTPGVYAPNFAVGAVLMMRFAEMAARWLPDVEIVELHHDRKEDAPSGTALLTAEMIGATRKGKPVKLPRTTLKVEGVRGGQAHQVPIHSVRLPGLVAHQVVLFGGDGELLTIRHDSMDRRSFMEGVKLCVREVRSLTGFVVGLDKILFRAG